jgi:hypothetical protein
MTNLPAERPVVDAEVVEQPPPPAGTRPPPVGRLATALAAAQKRCQPVVRDSVNSYHKFRYASAESVISEGRQALADAELALVPTKFSLDGCTKEGEQRFELTRRFLLVHGSGELLEISITWPVTVEKGMTLGRATAIASTTSLSYVVRDLLLLPRIDPQDDEEAAGPAEPKKLVSDEALGRINELMVALGVTEAQLKKALGGYGVDNAHQLSTEQAADMEGRLRKNLDARKAKEAAAAKPEANSTASTNV